MQQIKKYLSQIYDIKTVLLVISTQEFLDLAEWLSKAKKISVVFQLSEKEKCRGVDAVIYDWGCEKEIFSLKDIQFNYLIGRMKKTEDYFKVWECYRDEVSYIYIERDRGLRHEQITPDVASCEVLDWHREDSNIELSVILPVYNMSKYLPACIESLIKWKAPYVEYIFVNDGSVDESKNIILKKMETDSRIRLIDKINGGCASARNCGIRGARGKYIGFVDPDDFIDETMFYKLFRRALMGSYEYTYCGYKEYYEEDGSAKDIVNDCMKEPYLTGTYRKDKVQLLAVNTRVAVWRALYRKDVLEREGIWFHEDLGRFDDLPFRVEYIFAAGSAACVPEHLYYYRMGRTGQDISCTDKGLFVHFLIFEHLDKYTETYKDKRLNDLLQIIKIHTHGYALSKIQKQYKKEYMQKAKWQLNRNMGYWRTVILILMYTGKKNFGWYTKIKIKNWQ